MPVNITSFYIIQKLQELHLFFFLFGEKPETRLVYSMLSLKAILKLGFPQLVQKCSPLSHSPACSGIFLKFNQKLTFLVKSVQKFINDVPSLELSFSYLFEKEIIFQHIMMTSSIISDTMNSIDGFDWNSTCWNSPWQQDSPPDSYLYHPETLTASEKAPLHRVSLLEERGYESRTGSSEHS